MERAGLCARQPLPARSLRAVVGPLLVRPAGEIDATGRYPPVRRPFSQIQNDSDLAQGPQGYARGILPAARDRSRRQSAQAGADRRDRSKTKKLTPGSTLRSEERRVGKEGSTRWSGGEKEKRSN